MKPGAPVGTAAQISEALGEKGYIQRKQVARLVWLLGADQAFEMCRRAQEIEDAGGMLINNGKRLRTVGGIFFHLCVTGGQAQSGHEEELAYMRQHRRPPRARRAG